MSFADGWPRCEKDIDSLPLNTISCLLRSFRCYAYSFAALHCFSQSRFTSAQLHLQVRLDDLYPRWRQPRQRHWTMSIVCYADAGEWMKGMEHVAVRAHPDFFQQTESKACFWAWEWMVQLWFAVALAGIIPYHAVGALQKKAQGSQRCCRRWSGGVKRLSACSLPGDADDAIIYCKSI